LIISNPDPLNFGDDVNKIPQHIHEWFDINLISLNWENTLFMQFTTKTFFSNIDIIYKDKELATVDRVKFLGLTQNNALPWKKNIPLL
jgi:hypothetical protein